MCLNPHLVLSFSHHLTFQLFVNSVNLRENEGSYKGNFTVPSSFDRKYAPLKYYYQILLLFPQDKSSETLRPNSSDWAEMDGGKSVLDYHREQWKIFRWNSLKISHRERKRDVDDSKFSLLFLLTEITENSGFIHSRANIEIINLPKLQFSKK